MAYIFRPNVDGPVYVSSGDTLRFQYVAPSVRGFTEEVLIYIGESTYTWSISVPPPDFGADPFIFNDISNAALDSSFFYADGSRPNEQIVTVSGLSEGLSVPITITANLVANPSNYGIKINDSTEYILTDGSQTVQNGDTFTIFAKSQNLFASETRVVVSVGSTTSSWIITTEQQVANSPSPVPDFQNELNEELNVFVYSNVVQILGLTSPAQVSLSTSSPGATPQFAISSSNATTEDVNGYNVLNGVTFGTTGTVTNGQYLQLRTLSSSNPSTSININVSIGDGSGITSWEVRTNSGPSKEPNAFTFISVNNIDPSILVEAPMVDNSGSLTSISGLGEPVPVTLLSSTPGSNPRIKINNGSIGTFSNIFVDNGDIIYLYNTSSADENGIVETQIQVGTITIGNWQIQTAGPPITTPVFIQPPNLTGQRLNTFVSSSLIELTAINTPIQINATNGALISIDSDTPVEGPRTFDPSVNNFVYLSILTSNSLNTAVSTGVTFGTAPTFTWSVTTAVSVPDETNIIGTWYSRKNEKYEGYAIGTVVQVLKESSTDYGNIETRFPGFIECDGRALNTFEYRFLHAVIDNTYGGSDYSPGVSDQFGATTTFNVPDYRNKRICGTGSVDGNSGSSKFLPIVSGGSNAQVGETGGWWYVDKVDVSGDNPFEQVTSPSLGANIGLESPFFTLGTVRTFGTEFIQGETTFTISPTSRVDGLISGITEVFVNVPPHEHLLLTSATESEGGEAIIPWGTRAYYSTDASDSNNNVNGPDVDESPGVDTWLRGQFISLLTSSGAGDWSSEVQRTGLNVNTLSYPTTEATTTQSFGNYWYSDGGSLNLAFHQEITPTFNDAGVIDTISTTASVNTYISPGTLKSHSHALGLVQYTSVDTDYTYGNVSGVGTFSGLGGYSDSIQITFNQSEVLVGLNEAQFTFSNTKRPTPTFYLEPQRTVPVVNQFHKIKYIIKAY